MPEIILRKLKKEDWSEVGDLIHVSMNYWCEANGRPAIFQAESEKTQLFCEVYEMLDPGCCIIAEQPRTGRIMGSCFYHPRETHVSLGIMNVHPNYFGHGIARKLLGYITDFAEDQGLPVRLVSSAMNLDSYSLYTKAGFVPRCTYQDLFFNVPESGMAGIEISEVMRASGRVRKAVAADVPLIVALEEKLSGIRREKDYWYYLENELGIWGMSVLENLSGGIDGFMVSVSHAASTIVGPGLAEKPEHILLLLRFQLDQMRGQCPVFLVPVEEGALVRELYRWGAKNCEIHFHQVLGNFEKCKGVNMPTFMPETG